MCMSMKVDQYDSVNDSETGNDKCWLPTGISCGVGGFLHVVHHTPVDADVFGCRLRSLKFIS